MKNYEFEMVTTRNGDGGKSTDYSGESYWKDHLIFEVVGGLDELSSWVGRCQHQVNQLGWALHRRLMSDIQYTLQHGGSLVATNPFLGFEYNLPENNKPNPVYEQLTKVTEGDIERLEDGERKLLEKGVQIAPKFVLPGGTPESADIDIARTVCRRIERLLVGFMRTSNRHDLRNLSRYLNRLSDYLFILARAREQRL